MQYLYSAAIGYFLGSISPSYILARLRGVDIRQSGTKNLGASNTFLHFGRFWGFFVTLFDILKAYLSVLICRRLFPSLQLAALIGGSAAVLGHIYPAYLGFRGGRGLASFIGFTLSLNPYIFFILLAVGLCGALFLNYGCMLSIFAATLFPVLAAFSFGSLAAFLVCTLCSIAVIHKHMENLRRIRSGEETRLTDFLRKYLLKPKR